MTQVKRDHENQPDGTPEPDDVEAETDRADDATAVAPEPADAEMDAAAEPRDREAELEAELEQTKERLLRSLAEMENLRRRSEREIEDARKYAITGFARELLDVADSLNHALSSIPDKARENIELIKNLAEGVEMTQKALLGCFERHQIVKITPELGEKFDHNRHQAMYEVESDQHPPGTVAQVLRPGYTIADRLLRPAMVGVAKAPAGGSAAAGSGQAGTRDDAGDGGSDSASGERVDTTA